MSASDPEPSPQSVLLQQFGIDTSHRSPQFNFEDTDDDDSEGPRPLLLVALTGYRMLCMSTIIAFGTAKAILSARNNAGALSNTFDWLLGVVLAVV